MLPAACWMNTALAGVLLVGASSAAMAVPPPPAPIQQVQAPAPIVHPAPAHVAHPVTDGDISADNMILTALRIMSVLDAGRAGEVYDAASPTLKQAMSRSVFVNGVAKMRAESGVPSHRMWVNVAKLVVPVTRKGGRRLTLPPGNYVSIRFLAFSGANLPVYELVSFRNDGAGHMGLSGYEESPISPPSGRAARRR